MQRRTKQILIILAVVLLLASYPIYRGCYYAYREIRFYSQPRTQAEETVMAFAKEHKIPYGDYPQNLIDLLERNPETLQFVLEYPIEHKKTHEVNLSEYAGCASVPLFLQWDQRWGYLTYGSDVAGLTACGPMCLSMVGYYLTGSDNFSPDKVISFAMDNNYYVKGAGSSWSLISEGGSALGLHVKELPLVESRIVSNLEAGNPVICVVGPGDFTTTGHFIVLTAVENGMFRVNDPNSTENSKRLWSYDQIQGQIKNLWAISV